MILRKAYSLITIVLLSGIIIISSCCDRIHPVPSGKYKRVVLLYASAYNNLVSEISMNVSSMESGYVPSYDSENVLLAFAHFSGEIPRLIRFEKDNSGRVVRDTIAEYDMATVSTSADVLRMVMEEVKERYPSDNYGLILSSHGTGWVPYGYTHGNNSVAGVRSPEMLNYEDPYAYMVKSFGTDSRNDISMELKSLKNAIPYRLSFIILDVCFMGGVEVAYELKDKCDYIIASPAEVIRKGFPYDRIMTHLFNGQQQDLEKVCKEYFDFYDQLTGDWHTATVGLYKTSELESLALSAKQIFNKYHSYIQSINRDDIQRYYRKHFYIDYYNRDGWFWDLGDFIEHLATAEEYALFKIALDRVVVSKYVTEVFFSGGIVFNKYSGLSVYIPNDNDPFIESVYKEFDWNRDTDLIR